MILTTVIFGIITVFAFAFLYRNLKRLYSYLTVAQPEVRWDNSGARLRHMFAVAFGQTKIMREKTAGLIHIGIFWGFLVLLFSASEAVIQGFIPSFNWSFLGPFYTLITFFTDIFSVLIILAVIFALLRRFVFKVKRLQGDADEKRDASIVLLSIFTIVVSLLIQNAALTVTTPEHEWAFQPVSQALGSLIALSAASTLSEIFWWVHILAIFAFMNYLPYSKHLHVYTSILNVFFSPLVFANKLEKIDFEKEGLEKFGVVDIEDLSWKSIFDSYSCTHCGRCDDVCPAYTTGKELSPRNIMINIRHRTFDKAPLLLKMKDNAQAVLDESEQLVFDKKYLGDYQSIEAIWQCTSCGACMQECPVTNEHIPAIVGLRRSLVMMEANFPALLQTAFSNLETNGTPWAFSPSERADWAEGTGVKTAAENPDFDILFWVGCAGSFDDRAKSISLAFAKLMQAANINFAILGTEEQCNGDVARRAGNEYLADMLIKANVETLNRYNVKKIVTICPHCYNTFKNEFPDFGGNYEVIHHTEFLNSLIKEGKLKIKKEGIDKLNLAYHDSCYLGRYNSVYEAPRQILHQICGTKLNEVPRSKDKGFCCGAGGAQMFMEETEGKRINIERTEELLDTGCNTIVANCPFCMTMLSDGVKAKDKEESVKVKDIAEILLENME